MRAFLFLPFGLALACLPEEPRVGGTGTLPPLDPPSEEGGGAAEQGGHPGLRLHRSRPVSPVLEPAPEVVIPAGHAIVRDCYGVLAEEYSPSPVSGGVLGAVKQKLRSATGAVASAPVPKSAAPAGNVAADMMVADEEESLDLALDEEYPAPVAAEAGPGAAGRRELPPVAPGTERLDWGARFYLSNDDSMSLASAQRVLFAVENGIPLEVSEIRPHELLNYFSFDTAPVPEGQLFSVQGSAERTGSDSISLAFAVRGAVPPRRPLDLTLVVDRSGSMAAEGRLEYVKRGLHDMVSQLRRGDRVDLVLFDDEVCVPLEDYVVGRDDPELLESAIDRMQPRGSTDLDSGLKAGYALALKRVDEAGKYRRVQRVMVLTDAFLNTGDVDTDTVSEIGKAYEEHGIRLTGVGVGRDFNDEMLDKLTEKGKGAYVYLGSEAVVDRVFGLGFDSLTRTIAHDVHFALDLPDSLALARFYGEESSRNKEDVQPINYYAGTTQLFLQDLRVDPRRYSDADELTFTIEYEDAVTGERRSWSRDFTVGELLSADPHNVRKGRALMAWTDVLLEKAMSGSCGAAYATFAERVSSLQDDAEIAYVAELAARLCGRPVSEIERLARRVDWALRLDADIPIAEVALRCQGVEEHRSLAAGEKVARFELPPGPCTLTLQGTVPMTVQVEVPETGGQLRCVVRGGRVVCG